ncbi:hypothetical protein [Streptococcus devriesei]|nr:hypothetical protein [Streptococcus devriesei]
MVILAAILPTDLTKAVRWTAARICFASAAQTSKGAAPAKVSLL